MPDVTSGVAKSTDGRLGTNALTLAAFRSAGIGIELPWPPIWATDPGCAHDEVVRHRVGIGEHDLDRPAGLDDEPLTIEAHLLSDRRDPDDADAE